jgi:hypothetical protein
MSTDISDSARARLRNIGEWLIRLSENQDPAEIDDQNFRIETLINSAERASYTSHDDKQYSHLALEEWRDRERRINYFDEDLFGEPVWDMLLDLYIAYVAGQQVSITSACIASKVPATTALRWLDVMEDKKLIERTPDRLDKRRTWIGLTLETFVKMSDLLEFRARERTQNQVAAPFMLRSKMES